MIIFISINTQTFKKRGWGFPRPKGERTAEYEYPSKTSYSSISSYPSPIPESYAESFVANPAHHI